MKLNSILKLVPELMQTLKTNPEIELFFLVQNRTKTTDKWKVQKLGVILTNETLGRKNLTRKES